MNAVPGTARRRTAGVGALAVAAVLLTSCAAGRVAQTANQRPSIAGMNAQVGAIAVRDLSIEAPSQGTYYPAGSALRLTGVFVNNGTSPDQLTNISSSSISSWGAYGSITDGDEVVAAATASPTAAASTSAAAVSTSPAASSSGVSVSASSAATSASAGSSARRAPASPRASASTSSAPQAIRSITIPTGSRTSYGVPDATGSLLVLGTTTRIYPGSTVNLTLTFAKAGTVTVPVPVQITTDPTQASIPAPSSDSEGN